MRRDRVAAWRDVVELKTAGTVGGGFALKLDDLHLRVVQNGIFIAKIDRARNLAAALSDRGGGEQSGDKKDRNNTFHTINTLAREP